MNKKVEVTFSNILIYFIGALLIALGVVILIRSNLGVSTWDTLHYGLSKLTGISLGSATIYVALSVTLFVIIVNKNLKYLFMVIPILLVGNLIDIFNLHFLLNNFEPSGIMRVVGYITGLIFLPAGGSMLIVSTLPAGVFDELMLTLLRIFKTNRLTLVRTIMELCAVAIALVLSLMAGEGFGMINIGTLIFSLSVGKIINLNLKLYERVGKYEFEQND
ncbi:hypothetical protein CI105_05030 [Candidatus Izimaplasma bacterium ZiA1]|uniref:YczE/YyaS/YitT family protein n=1 Tax=Candidatus Izimoplasma sp. ZiA1 TaxID=2024899 RepID=UPI000BAA7284|nr:hypothetical protein CI105_05030 [Candidatus Izimaplasma bacterium ZiA1]